MTNVTAKLQKSSDVFQKSNKKIMNENVILLQEINSLKKEHHQLMLQIKVSKAPQYGKNSMMQDSQESEQVQQMRLENQKLSEEIAMLEQRDNEINEQVKAMSEQAEFSLRQRQMQRKPAEGAQDAPELNSKMEPAQMEGSLDEGQQA